MIWINASHCVIWFESFLASGSHGLKHDSNQNFYLVALIRIISPFYPVMVRFNFLWFKSISFWKSLLRITTHVYRLNLHSNSEFIKCTMDLNQASWDSNLTQFFSFIFIPTFAYFTLLYIVVSTHSITHWIKFQKHTQVFSLYFSTKFILNTFSKNTFRIWDLDCYGSIE